MSQLVALSVSIGLLGGIATILYLKADICRQDLAVEIEAVGGFGWQPGE